MQGVLGLRARQPSPAHVQWPTAAAAQRSRMPGTHWHCLHSRIAVPDAHRRMPLLPAPAPGALPTIRSTPDRQLTGAKDHSIAAATPTAPDNRPGQHCGCRTTPACSARGVTSCKLSSSRRMIRCIGGGRRHPGGGTPPSPGWRQRQAATLAATAPACGNRRHGQQMPCRCHRASHAQPTCAITASMQPRDGSGNERRPQGRMATASDQPAAKGQWPIRPLADPVTDSAAMRSTRVCCDCLPGSGRGPVTA